MEKSTIYKTEAGRQKIANYYNNLLKNWVKPSEQLFIDTAFGKTFIIGSGEKTGETVILLHGSGSNAAMWMADALKLSEKYHVFAIDIIGECNNSSETRPPFNENNYANWLNEIFEKLTVSNVSIVGCSLGGWIALNYAIEFPEKVNKLILTATAGITQIRMKTIFWIMITSMMGQKGFDKLNKMVYGNAEIDQQTLEFAIIIKDNYIPRTDVLPIFSDENLRKIKASTLFIGGENDCFYDSKKTALRLEKNIKNAECHVHKDTGHVLLNQTQHFIDFLEENKITLGNTF